MTVSANDFAFGNLLIETSTIIGKYQFANEIFFSIEVVKVHYKIWIRFATIRAVL